MVGELTTLNSENIVNKIQILVEPNFEIWTREETQSHAYNMMNMNYFEFSLALELLEFGKQI